MQAKIGKGNDSVGKATKKEPILPTQQRKRNTLCVNIVTDWSRTRKHVRPLDALHAKGILTQSILLQQTK